MDYITILAIALSLSFDTFAVSLSYGVVRNQIIFSQATGVAIVFAIFQGGLTVGGFFFGSIPIRWIQKRRSLDCLQLPAVPWR
jgi:manganese efflux pump family protein